MSSILDALKKAERESTADRGAGTPWPAPLPATSSYRQRSRRWWMPLGIVVGLCIFVAFFWQTRQPEITRPGESMTEVPKSNRPHGGTTPSAGEKKQMRPPTKLNENTPNKAMVNEPVGLVQEPATMAAVRPLPPEKKPSLAATPVSVPKVLPSAPLQAQAQRPAAVLKPEPVTAVAEAVSPSPEKNAPASSQPATDTLETGIAFRNDPRIDLQALVWASETAERFVVINNRLIKEGGAIDNIVVIRINPDDVVLTDGSDRWHEAFTIR